MKLTENAGARLSLRVTLLFLPIVAVVAGCAAPPAISGGSHSDGKIAGLFSGLVLLMLVAGALVVCVRPRIRRARSGFGWVLLFLVVLWIVKTALLPFLPGLGVDVGTYQAWALRVTDVGPANTYQLGYYLEYPPGYLYALWPAGLLVRALGASGQLARVILESPPLIADFFLALTIFALLRPLRRLPIVWAGTLFVALNPALLFNSVAWGQSDSLLTLLMLLSVMAILRGEYELGWAMAAIALLMKPQALIFLPVLGFWMLFRHRFREIWRCAAAFVAVMLIGIAPFQIAHPWNWIVSLYSSMAAQYSETSVNAFNLMALVGGLRQPDSTTVLGVSYYSIGMALLIPLYALIGYLLWLRTSPRALFYGIFLSVFGFFMLAPRMHERYLYPALVFAVPLALEDSAVLAIAGVLTLTYLFNLAYVKHALETIVFLKPRDAWAMVIALINLATFGFAVTHVLPSGLRRPTAAPCWDLTRIADHFRAATATRAAALQAPALPWVVSDWLLSFALTLGAAVPRFWRLGSPAEIVFDEVHFVGQARHYLRAEDFLDPHPPLAKLLIAAGILLFGDHPWSWRVANAVVGTARVTITYLLGRRMFHSRLAAAFAALFVACDGIFLVDSRIAVIDIVYVTAAAASYLFFFQFVQDGCRRPATLIALGAALGLGLGAKLYVPALTFLLVTGFMIYALVSASKPARKVKIAGAVILTGAAAAIVYLGVFLPHFFLGWWGGISDLFHYYGRVIWYENSVASATHPYSSPWWSWPLMLRPIAYWQNFPKTGDVAVIWGGGNPLLWWGALTAIAISTVRLWQRPDLAYGFLVLGYVGYLAIWVPVGRTLFLYHYMPAVYLGYLALGAVAADCWADSAEQWERLLLLLTMLPVFLLSLGAPVGAALMVAVGAFYAALRLRFPSYAGKFLCACFVGASLALTGYFFPVWTALPLAKAQYYARMWFQGPGISNWI